MTVYIIFVYYILMMADHALFLSLSPLSAVQQDAMSLHGTLFLLAILLLVVGADAVQKVRGVLEERQDQDPTKKIMFWRPQKVGSVRASSELCVDDDSLDFIGCR